MANEEIGPLVRQALIEIIDSKHRHEDRRAGKLPSLTADDLEQARSFREDLVEALARIATITDEATLETAIAASLEQFPEWTAKQRSAAESIRWHDIEAARSSSG